MSLSTPGDSSESHTAAPSDDSPILVVKYEGRFDLCWLWPDETVRRAGDGSGACIVSGPDYETRVNKGDLIEVAEVDEDD